jgi:hypothetical protein
MKKQSRLRRMRKQGLRHWDKWKKKTDQRDWNNEEKLKKLRTNIKTGEKSKKQYKERNKK